MIALIGAGQHAEDIACILHRTGIHNARLFDDDSASGYPSPNGIAGYDVIVGVNNPIIRRDIAQRFSHLRIADPTIHPTVSVEPDLVMGRGVVIGAQSALGSFVRLANHVHVNTCVSIVRTNVEAYSTISPGAVICGNVNIGEATQIGAGSVVCERSVIGNEVVVGAGAIVPPYSYVPDGTTVIGVWHG